MPTNQPGSWLDHKQLAIMRGLGATATDNLTAENPIKSVSLLTDAISLTLDGWSPQIPNVKNGGIWSDSPISDGRQLLAAPLGNVTEKMTVIIKGNSYLDAQHNLVALGQMASDCRDYWQGIAQIDPVYLLWASGCNNPPLPQYALLYNIELAPEYLDSPTPAIRVSMTLERAYDWRPIPPGANPKLWTFYINNQQLGLGGKVLADMDLDASTVPNGFHLAQQILANKFEWTPASAGQQSTAISQNYISIPANLVPGDLPALVCISLYNIPTLAGTVIYDWYIGKTSKPLSRINHASGTHSAALNLNAGDGNTVGVFTKVAVASSIGVISNNSSTLFYLGRRTSTGVDAGWITCAQWGGSPGANGIILDRNLMRGTYAVFARLQNASGTPVLTEMKVRILVEEFEDNADQYVASVSLPEVSPPLNSGQPQLSYMGTVTIPLSSKVTIANKGYGLQITEGTTSNLRISLQQQVLVATANRILEAIDLIFMPMDEGLCQIAPPSSVNTTGNPRSSIFYDNTGYLGHGNIGSLAASNLLTGSANNIAREVRGNDIYLTPRVDQRLYFLVDGNNNPAGAVNFSELVVSNKIAVNIVPRWAGIRDT